MSQLVTLQGTRSPPRCAHPRSRRAHSPPPPAPGSMAAPAQRGSRRETPAATACAAGQWARA
eukprot:3828382-Prymnesium_polylepis.1